MFPFPLGVLFFFTINSSCFILYKDIYIPSPLGVLFFFTSPSIKPLFYDMLFGYFRENYLNFQFSFQKEQKLCSNSHFYSIVAIFI